MRKRVRHLLLLLPLVAAAPAVAAPADRIRPPVFFEEPDPATRDRIRAALDDIERPQIHPRTRGRETLTEIGYWAIAPLLDLVANPKSDAVETRNAALVLGEIGDPAATAPLLKVSRTANHQYVGAYAALAVGMLRDPATVPALRDLIRDPSRDDRRIASILAVTKIGAPVGFEVLVDLLRTEKLSLVREAAVFCLGFFRDQALVPGAGGLVPCPELRDALRSSEIPIRRAAVVALALLGHRDLKPIYADLVARESDAEVKRIALLALGRFGDKDVTDTLLDILADEQADGSVRLMAAFLLKDRRDPAALDRLKALIRRGFPRESGLRAAVTLALSNFEDPGVVDLLLRSVVADPKDRVRSAAAIGLSRMTDPAFRERAVGEFTKLLRGEYGPLDDEVRYNVGLARERLQKEDAPGEFDWQENAEFGADLPKDLEEKVLDVVNEEAGRVLGLAALSDLRSFPTHQRTSKSDQNHELRDLDEHLARHPYFVPADVPEPKVAITPRDADAAGAAPGPGKGR